MEQLSAVSLIRGHFHQVIVGGEIFCIELLGLQIASVAIHFHLGKISEAKFPHIGICELVQPRLRNPYLSPFSLRKYRLCGISACRSRSTRFCQYTPLSLRLWRRLHLQHEAYENLPPILTHDERTEENLQTCLLSADGYALRDNWRFGQPVIGQGLIVGQVTACHVNIFGIQNAHRVDGVLVVAL